VPPKGVLAAASMFADALPKSENVVRSRYFAKGRVYRVESWPGCRRFVVVVEGAGSVAAAATARLQSDLSVRFEAPVPVRRLAAAGKRPREVEPAGGPGVEERCRRLTTASAATGGEDQRVLPDEPEATETQ
jgi:hypothetical protein